MKGKLEYMTWQGPWFLYTDQGTIDLRPKFWEFALAHSSKLMSQDESLSHYEVKEDEQSETILYFQEVGQGIILKGKDGQFLMSNLMVYLENAMMRFNGRQVEVTIDTSFRLSVDPDEDVPARMYKGSGNSARVPDETFKSVCKAGTADCCIFVTAGGDGFSCEKFNSPLARILLDRRALGNIRATRIGDCKLVGREER